MRRAVARTLAACALVGLAGCESATDGEGWPVFRVVGRVATSTGEPVAGARVIVVPRRGGCDASDQQQATFVADGRGNFRGGFSEPAGRFEGCVVVMAASPAARATQLTGSTQRPDVTFRDPARDSIVVNVVLTP